MTYPVIVLRPVASAILIGSPGKMPRLVPTVSATAVSWLPIGKSGMVSDVTELVTIAPSVTVQLAPVKFPGAASVRPDNSMGDPVSSSNNETVTSKSSRLENSGRRRRSMYIAL